MAQALLYMGPPEICFLITKAQGYVMLAGRHFSAWETLFITSIESENGIYLFQVLLE